MSAFSAATCLKIFQAIEKQREVGPIVNRANREELTKYQKRAIEFSKRILESLTKTEWPGPKIPIYFKTYKTIAKQVEAFHFGSSEKLTLSDLSILMKITFLFEHPAIGPQSDAYYKVLRDYYEINPESQDFPAFSEKRGPKLLMSEVLRTHPEIKLTIVNGIISEGELGERLLLYGESPVAIMPEKDTQYLNFSDRNSYYIFEHDLYHYFLAVDGMRHLYTDDQIKFHSETMAWLRAEYVHLPQNKKLQIAKIIAHDVHDQSRLLDQRNVDELKAIIDVH